MTCTQCDFKCHEKCVSHVLRNCTSSSIQAAASSSTSRSTDRNSIRGRGSVTSTLAPTPSRGSLPGKSPPSNHTEDKEKTLTPAVNGVQTGRVHSCESDDLSPSSDGSTPSPKKSQSGL